jgi:hypothetical protein
MMEVFLVTTGSNFNPVGSVVGLIWQTPLRPRRISFTDLLNLPFFQGVSLQLLRTPVRIWLGYGQNFLDTKKSSLVL